jgi:hypothetical protein
MNLEYAEAVTLLSQNITKLITAYDKRQKEVIYVIERLKNLSAIANLSDNDVPKDLIGDWINETIGELLIMEDIIPESITAQNED